jgi:hypothetical protein
MSSSITVIGGVRGKVVGIGHSIMTEGGVSIRVYHLGMEVYQEVGEIIIEPICGEDILGLIVIYLTMNFGRTGEAGTRLDTGETNEIGVLKVDTVVQEQKVEQSMVEQKVEQSIVEQKVEPVVVTLTKVEPQELDSTTKAELQELSSRSTKVQQASIGVQEKQ